VLSDWTDEDPNSVYATLKKEGHYYNFNRRTLADLAADIRAKGLGQTAADRHMWNMMQMSSRDISDVTGYTYTFLMNGHAPADGWVGLFSPGERIRLRIINASSMTFFDVRIPGLKMRVISSDGQYVDPVSVDEIRLGVAETYDVLVEPDGDVPYTLFAQAIDRSGYARGTLTPDPTLRDEVPVMDPTVELTHMDMGMAHDMSAMAGQNSNDMSSMQHDSGGHSGHDMGGSMDMSLQHAPTEFGPNVDMRAEMAPYRLDDPGIGLRDHMQLYGRRVLTYADLHNLRPTPDPREPQREIELHLTGNMHRYMWSINGIDFASAEPLFMHQGERLRITLVNDTMMNHPIHLHGLWSDLETGDMQHIPRKHTVIVQPGSRISYRVSADYLGRWAYHCHLLYHMPGMMREVRVLPGASS
jgi:CopA family copper-resistance protein